MYPFLKEGVSIGTYQMEGSNTTYYFVENAEGEEFQISHSVWNALLHADGTHPLDLPDNGSRLLPKLKRYGVVQTSRFVRQDGLLNRFVLFSIGNRLETGKSAFKAINAALPVVSVLIFATGLFFMMSEGGGGEDLHWRLYFGLLALSVVIHELGHLIAGLAYGFKIRDAGILLLDIIPIGAYVSHLEKKHAKTAEQIQFSLAGIEANLLLAGICLLLAPHCDQLSSTILTAANANVLLSGINLLPVSGLDGESALSAACGITSISDLAKKCLSNRKNRQELLNSGLQGYVCFGILSLTLFARVILGLFIVLAVLSGILIEVFVVLW